MIKIIPSIASANLLCVGDEIKKAEKYGAVHLDIEDGIGGAACESDIL